MKQKLLVLLALAAFSVNLFGQNVPKFTLESVKYPKFVQVLDTSMWLVTNNGEVEHYTRSGKLIKSLKFKTETFDDDATSLYVDANNHIWIGTGTGLAIYDGKSWQYHTDAIGDAKINFIQQVGTDVWIGTSNGAFKFTAYEPASNINALIPTGVSKNIVALCAASNGDLWFSAYDYSTGGLLRYRNEQIELYNNAKGLIDTRVNTLIEDATGDIWASTSNTGVFRLDVAEDKLYNYTKNKGLTEKTVSGIVKDKHDTLWIATTKGLSKYVADEDTMISYNVKNSNFPSNQNITNIQIINNNIALAYNAGFCIFDRDKFVAYDSLFNSNGIHDHKLYVAGDSLFYITANGSVIYENSDIHSFAIGLVGSEFHLSAQAPDGSLWYTNNSSNIFMLDTKGIWHAYPLPSGTYDLELDIYKISFNPNGEVWFASNRGILVYNKGKFSTITKATEPSLPSDTINDIAFIDAQNYYIATEAGLVYYTNGTYTIYNRASGLQSDSVRKIALAPDKSLWIACFCTPDNVNTAGISHLTGQILRSYDFENTFKLSICSSIAIDKLGNPWISGNYSKTKLIMHDGKKWVNYTDSLSNYKDIDGLVIDKDGLLWGAFFKPTDKIFSFNGHELIIQGQGQTFLDATIYNVSLDNNDNILFSTSEGVITIDKPIRLSFTADTTCVGLKTLLTSTTEPQVTQYKWAIIGENDTTQIGSQPTINYMFDNNGKYKVQLTVYDGVDSNWVSKTIDRNLIQPYSEQLKLVTAAEKDDKMIVAWEKTPDKGTAYYNIYRLEADGFIPVGKTMYDQPSYFYDSTANFKERAHTYKITTVDNCGTESDIDKSNEHTSMHLIMLPYGNDFQMMWTKYQGVANPKYIVYETSKTGTDTVRLAKLPSINTTYTVLKYNRNKTYRVAIDLGYTVDPLKSELKSDSGPYSQSMSNLAESIILQGVMLSNGFNAIVYPVPATDFCTVSVDETEPADYTVSLVNADGKTVYSRTIARACKLDETIQLKNIARGTYVLTVSSRKGTNSTTVIVQ